MCSVRGIDRRALLALSVTLALALSGISLYLLVTGGRGPINASRDRATRIALEFMRNSPTYKFDGIPETLMFKDHSTLESLRLRHVVTVVFDCRQSGYGDRTEQVLAQVVTHHGAVVRVVKTTIVSAVIDQRWDEVNQRILDEYAEEGEQAAMCLFYSCL